jgi:hypothetical protein
MDDGGIGCGIGCGVLQLCKSIAKLKKKDIAMTVYPLRLQFCNVGNLLRSIRRCGYGVVNRLVDDEGQVAAFALSRGIWSSARFEGWLAQILEFGHRIGCHLRQQRSSCLS